MGLDSTWQSAVTARHGRQAAMQEEEQALTSRECRTCASTTVRGVLRRMASLMRGVMGMSCRGRATA